MLKNIPLLTNPRAIYMFVCVGGCMSDMIWRFSCMHGHQHTFFSSLASFLIPLMKSLLLCRYSSYSSKVMSPFSTSTWGR